jgi:hypothetical protein
VRAPSRLSGPLTSFVGRERVAHEIRSQVETVRLVTLAGPPGIGKTRLALHVAAALADRFDDIHLVELAALHDPVLVARTVAHTLGVHEQPDQALATTLVQHVGQRSVLALDRLHARSGNEPVLQGVRHRVAGGRWRNLEGGRSVISAQPRASPSERTALDRIAYCLAEAARMNTELDQAQALISESVTVALEAGDRWSAALALISQGWYFLLRGNTDSAKARAWDSLDQMSALGDLRISTCALETLGAVPHTSVSYTRARTAQPQFPNTPPPPVQYAEAIGAPAKAWLGTWADNPTSPTSAIRVTIERAALGLGVETAAPLMAVTIHEEVDPGFDGTFETSANFLTPQAAALPYFQGSVFGTLKRRSHGASPWVGGGLLGTSATSLKSGAVAATVGEIDVPSDLTVGVEAITLADVGVHVSLYTAHAHGSFIGYVLRYSRVANERYTYADVMLSVWSPVL